MRRLASAACILAPSGPTSANAGMRKKLTKPNIPTHSAPETTWRKRRTIISIVTPEQSSFVYGQASLSARAVGRNHRRAALPPPHRARGAEGRSPRRLYHRAHHQRRLLGEPAARRRPGAYDLASLPPARGRRHRAVRRAAAAPRPGQPHKALARGRTARHPPRRLEEWRRLGGLGRDADDPTALFCRGSDRARLARDQAPAR